MVCYYIHAQKHTCVCTHEVSKVACHILGLRVPTHIILIQEAFFVQMRYFDLHVISHWESVIPLMRQTMSSKENARTCLKRHSNHVMLRKKANKPTQISLSLHIGPSQAGKRESIIKHSCHRFLPLL